MLRKFTNCNAPALHLTQFLGAGVQVPSFYDGGFEGVIEMTADAASAGPAPQQGEQQGTSWLDKVGSCRARRLCVLLHPLHGLLTQQDEAGESLKLSRS